jgi:STE24 endopeptidase
VGIVVGMLTVLAVWGVSVPFTFASTWWDRRYDVSELGYVEAVFLPYAELGVLAVLALVAIVIVMWLARRSRGWWWLVAAPAFAGLAAAFSFVLPYVLTVGVERVDTGAFGVRIDELERATGSGDTPVFVEEVSSWTDAPNAYATGIGPSARVVLWDTLFLGSSEREVDFVVAHELGHVARDHVWKGIAWFAILAVPSLLAVHVVTRGRGGLGEARNVPLAALAFACIGLCLAPAQNAISRHFEREADWIGLEATRDPEAAQEFFVRLTGTILADPTPPSWAQALFGSHPSDLERIAMARAWEARR